MPDPTYEELVQRVNVLEEENQKHKSGYEKIIEQNGFFNLVLESLAHPFYVINADDYTIQWANSAAKAEAANGRSTCYALTHKRQTPCDSKKSPCPLEIIKQTKKPVTVEHIHYDSHGDPRHVEVHAHPILDKDGKVSGIIEYTWDITKRKRVEEALRESELKFRSVTQSAKDAIVSANANGIITACNKAFQNLFGYEEPEIIGQPLTVLMPASFVESHKRALANHVKTGESRVIGQTLELAGLTKGGLEFPLELSISSWQVRGKIYYTGIIRDISQRKQIEEERNQLIKSLQDSLAKIKTLSGMLPICASCKNVRDDKGYWNQIETYIHNHSEAQFTHGICPECAKKLYPDYV
jgi:PAS domain S-box-containing protein